MVLTTRESEREVDQLILREVILADNKSQSQRSQKSRLAAIYFILLQKQSGDFDFRSDIILFSFVLVMLMSVNVSICSKQIQ